MIRRVIIRPEAKQDLREAKAWYANISRELGNAFHPPSRRRNRSRTGTTTYDAGENRIVVVAVLHQARDPEMLESRKA